MRKIKLFFSNPGHLFVGSKKRRAGFIQPHFSWVLVQRIQKIFAGIKIKKVINVQKSGAGFTLIDSILSLSIVAVMVLVFASLAGVRDINRRVSFRAQAAALADEQINALRRLDATSVASQTNGSFKNILYNAGRWNIITDSGSLDTVSSPCPPPVSGQHCGANVVELSGATGFSNTASGRLLFPAGAYSDAVLQASWKVIADSPSNWAVGYLFRAQDSANGYRLRVGSTTTDFDPASGNQNFVLDKLVNGVSTVIFSKPNVTFNTSTWYTLKVDFSGSSIKMYLNGNQQDSGTVTDLTFTTGSAALLGWGGVHAEVDNVQAITSTTSSWNFEGGTSLPAAWIRLSLNDFPDSTTALDDNGLLTIAPYPQAGSTNLKKATITIQWRQGGSTASYTTSALLGRSSLGQ